MEQSRAGRFLNHLNYLIPKLKSFGILSWENSNTIVKKQNKNLESLLRSGALPFHQIKGIYGNLINPFFIYNTIKSDLIQNALYGEQHEVIYGEIDRDNVALSLIECSTGNTIGSRKINEEEDKIDYAGESFSVPFFDEEPGNIRIISKNFIFLKTDFSITTLKKINACKRYDEMFSEDKTGKHRWLNRGIYLSKISKLKRGENDQ